MSPFFAVRGGDALFLNDFGEDLLLLLLLLTTFLSLIEHKQILVQVFFVWTICLSVCLVDCGKTTDWIWILFEVVGRLGTRMTQVVGIGKG